MRDASIRVALWSMHLGHTAPDIEGWVSIVEAGVAEADARGARVLVIPEWVGKQWLAFAPPDLRSRDEPGWIADQAPRARELLAPLAARHGLALVAGSFAAHAPGATPPLVNRAHVFLPGGTELHHDKLRLVPSERDPDDWNLSTGSRVTVFDLGGVRAAVVICLDIELPALSARLAPAGIDLLLVPSYTSRLSGFSRVFSCARARAVELLATVCAVGLHGTLKTANGSAFQAMGGASVYVPCEPDLGMHGILAEIPPRSDNAPGELLVADVPVGRIRALREQSTGEVWPGAWDARHVEIVDVAAKPAAVRASG